MTNQTPKQRYQDWLRELKMRHLLAECIAALKRKNKTIARELWQQYSIEFHAQSEHQIERSERKLGLK